MREGWGEFRFVVGRVRGRRGSRRWEKLRAAFGDREIAGILRFTTPACCARRGPRFAQNDAASAKRFFPRRLTAAFFFGVGDVRAEARTVQNVFKVVEAARGNGTNGGAAAYERSIRRKIVPGAKEKS